MSAYFSALRFLTILPIPLSWCGDEESFRRSSYYFPLVGLTLGAIYALGDVILRGLFPPVAAAALLLLLMIVTTGALHMDGLADAADAFFSGRDRERMLEIMKDSNVGAMGATAIALYLLLKLSLLLSLPDGLRWQTILLMPLAGRCLMLIFSSWLPYARSVAGTGSFVAGGGAGKIVNAVSVLLLASLLVFGWSGLLICGASLLCSWGVGVYSRFRIGGYTGDILGAGSELIELIPALSVLLLAQQGVL